MFKHLLAIMLLVLGEKSFAQTEKTIRIVDEKSNLGIPMVVSQNISTNEYFHSNKNGLVIVKGSVTDTIKFYQFGYKETLLTLAEITKREQLVLKRHAIELNDVEITVQNNNDLGLQKIDKINLKLLPVNNAQDLLKTVNGLFIAQHAGGGKAEQIFLRGFDNDHGTDFGVFIDGIPVNLSNHAHGQGYADMHFIIPELIQDADFYKGPYEMKNGNFVVSGAARFKTKNGLDNNTVKLDIGQYGYQRALLMLDATPNNRLFTKNRYENAYIAIEGTLNKGFFESAQDFRKVNGFASYSTDLTKKTILRITGSHFNSDWKASGQVPLRAINNGSIGWFGAIDDTEGGATSRTNISLKISSFLKNNQELSHFAYYAKNKYQLYSNFTFYLNDPVNGDMIEQLEDRDLFGYNSTYKREDEVFNKKLTSTFSAGFRTDFIHSKLITAIQRKPLEVKDNNKVHEYNFWGYFKESWKLHPQLTLEFGTRFDVFTFNIHDQIGDNSGTTTANRWSPKASFFYEYSKNALLFLKGGAGFHSNYSHAAVADPTIHPLPRAVAFDLGSEFKVGKKFLSTVALWTTQSDAEYIFVADAGEFENNGRSLRYGIDLAGKYEPIKNVFFDFSLNYSIGKLLDATEGENSIPAAPRFNSTASLSYQTPFGLKALITSRYMAQRPLTEDETVIADAYFLMDATVSYQYKKVELAISAQNIFNEEWMEAVFYDASRLKDEPNPVEDLHFTPGTPFFLKGTLTYSF